MNVLHSSCLQAGCVPTELADGGGTGLTDPGPEVPRAVCIVRQRDPASTLQWPMTVRWFVGGEASMPAICTAHGIWCDKLSKKPMPESCTPRCVSGIRPPGTAPWRELKLSSNNTAFSLRHRVTSALELEAMSCRGALETFASSARGEYVRSHRGSTAMQSPPAPGLSWRDRRIHLRTPSARSSVRLRALALRKLAGHVATINEGTMLAGRRNRRTE